MTGKYTNVAYRLRLERPFLLRRALSEACHWNRRIEKRQSKPSDQYWIGQFAAGRADKDSVKRFLSTYQISRATWNASKVATLINELSKDPEFDPASGMTRFAVSLSGTISSANAGQRTSAASKLAMFTRPATPVFIWDRLALTAMKVRTANNQSSGRPRRFRSGGSHDYAAFHAACMDEFKAEREEDSFRTAVKDFAEFVSFTRDGVSLADQGYFERRLFDKLLVCEGERIEELLLAAR